MARWRYDKVAPEAEFQIGAQSRRSDRASAIYRDIGPKVSVSLATSARRRRRRGAAMLLEALED